VLVPPHNLQAEESLLGAMLLSPEAVLAATEIVTTTDFYKPSHGAIFGAIVALAERSEPVDVVAVSAELGRTGLASLIGDPSVLLSLQANTPSIAHAANYARIVSEAGLRRALIGAGHEVIALAEAPTDDVLDLVDQAEAGISAVAGARFAPELTHVTEAVRAVLDAADRYAAHPGQLLGVPTGFPDLDAILSGLRDDALYVVGGTSSMGKTSFVLSMIRAAARLGTPTLLCSLEMGSQELVARMVSIEAKVPTEAVEHGRLTDTQWLRYSAAAQGVANWPLYIEEGATTLSAIRAKARRAARRHNIGLIVVDYLQLVEDPATRGQNRAVEVGSVAQGLKRLAKELHVPVVAPAQINRQSWTRTDKRPNMADLRESGQIEQAADVVLGLHRPVVFDPDIPERDAAQVGILKNRLGGRSNVWLDMRFAPAFGTWESAAHGEAPSSLVG